MIQPGGLLFVFVSCLLMCLCNAFNAHDTMHLVREAAHVMHIGGAGYGFAPGGEW